MNYVLQVDTKSRESTKSRSFNRIQGVFLIHRQFPRSLCSSPAASDNSFTVSYLVDSCGFPPDKAISASKYLKFKTSDRADSVIAFLKNQGFTKTQIAHLVPKYPVVLRCNPEKNLLPKFEFLSSIGLSDSDIVKLVIARPITLGRSLKNHIEPAFNLLRDLIQSNDKTLTAIKNCPQILVWNSKANIAPNIQLLRDFGVPGSSILFLLTYQPKVFLTPTSHFKKGVQQVMEMGFDPLKTSFMLGIHVIRSVSKSTWEKKMETYEKWGWSKDQILVAFRAKPWCMMMSVEKIDKVMEFLVNKMGLETSAIAKNCVLISHSMENRIIPRSLVYRYCLENGLIKDNSNFGFVAWLKCSENLFIKKLKKFETEAPDVLKFYQEKLGHGSSSRYRIQIKHKILKFCRIPVALLIHRSVISPSKQFLLTMFNLVGRNFRLSGFITTSVHNRLFPRSSSSSPAASDNSFAASYLIDSCGFPSEKAISASKHLKFKTADRADSVIAFFKNQGFTETQIDHLVRKFPMSLNYHPEKNLLPKFEFLTSIGLSDSDIIKIFTSKPSFLSRSLKNHVEPTYNSLRDLLQSNDKTLVAIRRCAWILDWDFQTIVIPNMQFLRDVGVPGSKIFLLLTHMPTVFLTTTDHFKKVVEEVVKIGFDPLKTNFVLAVHAKKSMSKSTWEKKMETYEKWGWSKDQILVAFSTYPWCMLTSVEKIDKVMDYLVNKMGFETSFVLKNPSLISFSLEKRIIPRCLVYKYCLENGLVKDKKYIGFTMWLKCSENIFIKRLERYEIIAPGVLKFYREKLDNVD
ncbi:hypothetical protein LXL04_018378 [Taraxacum kok-saghyz]